MRKIETFDWWPQLVELKDELSLRELAERFSVTPGAVSAALKRGGLSKKPAPPGPRARRRQALPPEPGEAGKRTKTKKVAASPKPPAAVAAAAAGSDNARSGSKDHKLLPYLDILGKVSDGDVAKKAGVSSRTVANYRSRHGIDGYSGPRKARKTRKERRSKIDPFADMLGNVPDRVVAEEAGVSLNAVRNYRVKKGIAANGRGRPRKNQVIPVPAPETVPVPVSKSPATPRAAAKAPVASSGGHAVAWLVELASGETVVVAADALAKAASSAEGAGEVLSMKRLGRLV